MASNARRLEEQGRKAERLPLNEPTRLRPNSWSSVEAFVLDVSSCGFRARCDARVQRGGCISIELPGIGHVEAQVEWQRGDQFGARFLVPIEPGRCAPAFEGERPSLARLLLDRAGAREAGRETIETQLRRQILGALPMRRGGG